MGFGSVNVPGVSEAEFEEVRQEAKNTASAIENLRAELVSGKVSAALDTDDGVPILTTDGEELRAVRTLASSDTVAELVSTVTALTECESRTKAVVDTLNANFTKAIIAD
jgi:hypothetical protein